MCQCVCEWEWECVCVYVSCMRVCVYSPAQSH